MGRWIPPPHFPTLLDAFGVSVEAPSALRPPVPFFHIAEVATLFIINVTYFI